MYNWWLYETKLTLTESFGFSWILMDPYGCIQSFYGISWIPVKPFCWIFTNPHGHVRVLVQVLRILLILTDYSEISKIFWSHRFRSIPLDYEKTLVDLLWKHSGSDVKCEIAAAGRLIWKSRLRFLLISLCCNHPTQWNSSGNCLAERRTWQSTISNMARTSSQGVQRWQPTRT